MNAPANRPQLGDLPTMPIGEIAALPAAVLALLQNEAEEAVNAARHLADWLNGAVTVIADLPKKVEWDQGELNSLVAAIRAEDGDPAEYVDTLFRVPERKYAAWPRHIRTAFERARTVKPGKPTFRLALREAR